MSRAIEHPRTTVPAVTTMPTEGWAPILRLALVVSIVAAIVSAALTAVAEVPTAAVVLTVIVVAFAASWVRSGRTLS